MKNQTQLLKTRRFLPLFVTQFLGAFNDNAFKNAMLIWFAFDMAQDSGMDESTMVTLAAGLFILPFFLFSATAGQIADKYEKSWLVQRIKMAEIVLMICGSACFYLESVSGLLVVLFLMGTQSTFFGPIKFSLLPILLDDDELIAGNGLIEGGTFLSILLGTMFGGLIIRAPNGVTLLAFVVIVLAIGGWLSARRILESEIADPQLRIGWNIFSETWKIIHFARQEHTVWLSIIAISWFWFVGATFLTQFPVYTKHVIGGNEHIVTLLLAMFSIGIGLGSMFCNRLLRGEINGRLVPWGSLGISCFIIAFYISSQAYQRQGVAVESLVGLPGFFANPYSWAIMFSLLGLAITAGIYIVPLYAIVQHRSDEHRLSRVIAAGNVMNSLFMVVASFYAIAMYKFGASVTTILAVTGLVNFPVYLYIRDVVKQRLHQKNT